jgi:hypothetical protein
MLLPLTGLFPQISHTLAIGLPSDEISNALQYSQFSIVTQQMALLTVSPNGKPSCGVGPASSGKQTFMVIA